MKRLALMLALLGGCSLVLDGSARHPIAWDVPDGAVIVAASTVAIADRNEYVRGTALGIDALALALIPALVIGTYLHFWRPR